MAENILTAVIGASVAVIGLVVAKESKTSDFRQQWIDGLRNDLADFISLSIDIAMKSGANKTTIVGDKQLEVWQAANTRLARIQLRINPREALHQNLVSKLQALEKAATHSDAKTTRLAEEVVSCSQQVLKKEWQRVKRGEWKYLSLLIISSLSLLTCLGYALIHWLLKR